MEDGCIKKKVLLTASYASCPRTWKMAKSLADHGFEVHVLEWDRDSKLPKSDLVNGIFVHRMALKASYGYKMFSKLPFWCLFIFFHVLGNSYDIAQTRNFDNLLPALIARFSKKFKCIYDIADFYADTYISARLVKFRKVIKWFDQNLMRKADSIILVNNLEFNHIGLKKQNKSVIVIYNSHPELEVAFNNQRNNNSKFTVFYAGILQSDRGLHQIVDATQNIQGVELVIAGFGEMEQSFLQYIDGKKNMQFLGRIPHDQVLKLTMESDCIIALYDPAIPNNFYASPNKLFEAMMCGKPIIVSRGTYMSKIVSEERCGLVIGYHDIQGLEKAISTLKDDVQFRRELGENAKRAYVSKYSWRLMEKRLFSLYDQLTN